MKSCLGGICAKNKGKVKVNKEINYDITYNGFKETDIDDLYDYYYGNYYIGAIVGLNEGEINGNFYVIDKGNYFSDRKDIILISLSDFN